ncbi:efflux RND transporter permease subunit [Noviherbaspirillum sp. CPCC 100848]|uniref:Efflux RND transporter permease subunit n=1 Tax=Noviherbaspirillum album TaxID=3080276 RepID=A0ABU6JH69_9BURK|nr:efflux RND transporter permease subunit [Noviherbaspirillum sp. CPCC 100848]MEC4723011.1 efflux RND transporter permease subunit [Noviherbaspirillum sp. CPCC 100848]
MWFTRISIGNPVLATMMMMVLVVLGLFSYQRLRVDQFPDITFPVVVVQTEYPGASPETIESDVTRKVEETVNTINGIKNLYSRSYEGSSVVIIEFDLTIDPAQAAQDVREKVALVKTLFRREVKEPRVMRFDPADQPIMSIAVTSDPAVRQRDMRELTTIADQVVKKRLENVRGVGSVTLVGGVKREIQIYVRPGEMEALGIGIDQVMNALRNENQELPTGAIRSAADEKVVQIQGKVKDPQDFNRIIVARRGGQPVTLSQIATVVDGQEEQESLALYNGKRTLAVSILKAQGQNTIDVADGMKEAIQDLEPRLQALYPGVKIEVIKDSSRQIRTGVDNVRRTMIEGAVLTILIVFLFLNSWRSTVITGLTLPVAIIGTFLFMYIFGFTINMITLMALSLCVGLLIDDAIVVRENIVRHAGMKVNGRYKDHRTASMEGTAEIGLAVLATTFSIVAVFLPVGFMGGIIGRFFHQFGITVVAAVLISMFVSFTLDPMLSSVWKDPAVHGTQPDNSLYGRTIGRVLAWFDGLVQWMSRTYQRLLAWSLRRRKSTLAIAAATFFAGFAIPASGLIGTEFVPQGDYSEMGVTYYTPVGSSIEFTESKSRQVENVLREFPEVRDFYTTVNTGSAQGKNYATTFIRLVPRDERERSTGQLANPMRQRLLQVAGITVTHVGSLDGVGGDNKQLRLSLQGTDLKQLARLTDEAMEKIRAIPGVVDLDSSLKAEKPTIAVEPKRDIGADLGVGVAQIGNALRPLLAGDETTTWRAPDDENYNVKVRLAPSDRDNADDLSRLMLASTQTNADGTPKMVPLRQVATITPSTGANQINRRDLSREVELSANVVGRSPGEVSAQVRQVLDAMNWQPGYRYQMGGSTKSMQESFGYALSALLLAIIFIYMILASQFASFLQPVAIMSALPMTLIGVFLALMVFRSTLNMFSIIGFIMLMGLVTKNAILLVDFANQARKAGAERTAALLEAAHVRLRPILMTTLAMVFGMVPLAFGMGEGSEQRAPMGQAVIGGIITSSLLTLVVVPVIYTYLDDFAAWARRKWHGDAADMHQGKPATPVLQSKNSDVV